MPQTSYSLDHIASVAGQTVSQDCVVGKYPASEAIPPGRMCELHTDGTVRLYRGGKRLGISMYRDAKEPGAWAVDDYVPILREGVIWASFSGGSPADLVDANISGPSVTTTSAGIFTDSAPAGTTDAEVYAGNGTVKYAGAVATNTSALGTTETLVMIEIDCAGRAERKVPTLLSQTSNDFAVTPENGTVYELNTTAAASTVSLATASPDGTVCYFAADGTKNGHTLTFRDVATAISAAATASKRLAAVAMKVSGKWTVTMTVGP